MTCPAVPDESINRTQGEREIRERGVAKGVCRSGRLVPVRVITVRFR